MSDLTKNTATLHVHFDDEVTSEQPTSKSPTSDENGRRDEVIEKNGTIQPLNYSRDDLMRLRNSSMAKRPPKFAADDTSIDDKRKEKIRMVVKMNGGGGANNFSSSNKRTTLPPAASFTDRKYRKNAVDTVAGSPAMKKESHDAIMATIDEKLPSERERLGFQQLMTAASGPNAVNPSVEHSIEPQAANVRRQRVGSGRITENLCQGGGLWNNGYRHSGSGTDKDVAFHLNYGIEHRHSTNDFFDKRHATAPTNAQSVNRNHKAADGAWTDAYEWNKENNRFPQIPSRESSAEPEWVSCGPTSKHDIIELHGFDGPNADADDNGKLKDVNASTTNSPPARSTPTKSKKYHEMPAKSDEHFNFEDFFKLDLPSGNHAAKGPGTGGESRFTQWFRRDSPPKKNATGFDANSGKAHHMAGQSFASTEQFIDLMHKTHGKKIESNLKASSAKFRSVEELEAELVAPTAANHAQQMHRQRQEQTKAANDLIDFRKLLTQMEQQILMQQQQQQNQHKANIVQQLYLLQQMNNTSQTQRERERETLMALLNVCNDNFMPRFLPHQQQQPHPQQQPHFMPNGNIGHNFRQFQANVANGMPPHSPTQQELHYHTQAIMQNALLKKQYEEQYRKSQQYQKQHHRSSMTPSPQPHFASAQPQFRNNKAKFNQMPKDGFQLMAPPQSKPIFGRIASTVASQRAGHANQTKFQNAAPNSPAAASNAPTPAAMVAGNNSVDITAAAAATNAASPSIAATVPAITVTADK